MTAKSDLQTLVGTLAGTSSAQITALSALVTKVLAFETAAVAGDTTAYDELITAVAGLATGDSASVVSVNDVADAFILVQTGGNDATEKARLQASYNGITTLAQGTNIATAQVHANHDSVNALIDKVSDYQDLGANNAAPVNAGYARTLIDNVSDILDGLIRDSTTVVI